MAKDPNVYSDRNKFRLERCLTDSGEFDETWNFRVCIPFDFSVKTKVINKIINKSKNSEGYDV